MQVYDRTKIKAARFRIKEWDYYLVVGDACAVAFTLSDDGYVGLQSVSLLELGEHPWEHTETILDAFPMGKFHLPGNSSAGDIVYDKGRLQLSYCLEEIEGKRCGISGAILQTFIRRSLFPVILSWKNRTWIPWSLRPLGIRTDILLQSKDQLYAGERLGRL